MKKLLSTLTAAALLGTGMTAAAFINVPVYAESKYRAIDEQLAELLDSGIAEKYVVIVHVNCEMPSAEPETKEERKRFYAKQVEEFLADAGIADEDVLTKLFGATSVTLRLTPEQIIALDPNDRVGWIQASADYFVPESTEPDPIPIPARPVDKQSFLDAVIAKDDTFNDGGCIYAEGVKFDAVPDMYGRFDLIVYGIDPACAPVEVKMNYTDYSHLSDSEFYCGMPEFITPVTDDAAYQYPFTVVYYINNTLPGFTGAKNIVEASRNKTYDIAQYIYPEIKAGDIDGDGLISASDASLVLYAYSELSTLKEGQALTLNPEMFDFNKDGKIDASDASDILTRYAELSTTE